MKGGVLMDFATKLLEFRAKWGLSQAEMCKILGVNKGMIMRYENHYATPRKVNLIAFAEKMRKWEEAQ